jgi:SAM-dependent methyltransferase
MKITTPEQLGKAVGGYRIARIIQTAVTLRIFDYIRAGKPADAKTVALKAGFSYRGTDILLDALTALGLITKTGESYENSSLAEQYLVSDTHSMQIFSIDHAEHIYRRWAYLPESVRDGLPHNPEDNSVIKDAESNRVFIRAMHARGLERGRKIASTIDLAGVRRVADIGGGAGSYLIALAEKIPDMEGVLFDLDLTLQTAHDIIHEHDSNLNFQLKECDIFAENISFGNDFDLVLLSNIIHIVGPSKNTRLFKHIKTAMAPHGRLIIQDFLLDDTATEPADAAFFAVNMLTGTETGRAWRETDVREWLFEAGFNVIERIDANTDSDVLIAR